jgi:heat shock protein HslJ
MNRILAFLFFMLFLAGIAFMMLQNMAGSKSTGDSAAATIVSGAWQQPGTTATVQFQVDGKVTGFGGCNNFFGTFVATDSTIDIGPLGSTRKACPENIMTAEFAFMQAVESAVTYNIVRETLTLVTQNGQQLDLTLANQDI